MIPHHGPSFLFIWNGLSKGFKRLSKKPSSCNKTYFISQIDQIFDDEKM